MNNSYLVNPFSLIFQLMVQHIQPKHIYEVKPQQFARILLKWNHLNNNREMPWKGISDPYKIWLSEIILQQTRVEQGLAYYNRFINSYPTINNLANAPHEEVFKLWEGLGYYSRCRNLLITADYISNVLNGAFPNTYKEILDLKGIGPYTAAAISSFAFNLPHAVVDGNVARVLARIFGLKITFDTAGNKVIFQDLAQLLLDKKKPGEYNQAMMDFGATICKPAAPLCLKCPFKRECTAYKYGLVDVLPLKNKKLFIKKRHFTYFIINFETKIALVKREKKDIWHQLFEFYLVESNANTHIKQILKQFCQENGLDETMFEILKTSPVFTQQLTHQHISCKFIEIKINKKLASLYGYKWVNRQDLSKNALPRIINQYLESS